MPAHQAISTLRGLLGPRLAHVAPRRAGSDFAASGPFFNTLLVPWIIDFLKKKSPAAARGGLGAGVWGNGIRLDSG